MRLFKYDFARAVAILCVVSVHCLYFMLPQDDPSWWYFIFMQIILFCGNAIFMMLSGRFNLRKCSDDDQVKGFYIRKIQTIIVPIAVFFVIRTIYDALRSGSALDTSLAISLLKNASFGYASMEYWFVFTLVGFLVVSPFLSNSFLSLSDFQQKLFLSIGLAWNLLLSLANNLNQAFSWGYLFSGFAFSYFIGSFIEQRFDTKEKFKKWMYAGALCLLLNALAVYRGWDHGAHDTSPLYTIFAIALYAALLSLGDRIGRSRLVSLVAEHSFSIYLIHMMILLPLENVLPRATGLSGIALHWGATAIVFSASLVASIIIDPLIIKPAQALYARAVRRSN